MSAAHPIPPAALDQPPFKTRVAKGPLATPRACACCGEMFAPHRKRDNARFCGPRCNWLSTKGPEFNAEIARNSAGARSKALRGRGAGKTYPKLFGRHEHRVVAEQKIGRPLVAGEVVHHVDGDKTNNDPANLQVINTQAEHARLHFLGSKQAKDHVAKRVASRKRGRQ